LLFRSTVSRRVTQKRSLEQVMDHLFEGSAEQLVKSLLGHRRVDAAELARVRRLIEDEERRRRRRK
jgi:predicted transcriptional regulator